MTTNQSSSSYSENNSAELQLGEDIQNYIAPNVQGSVEVKFDGYGTLHVMERDDDGKLIRDSFFGKREDVINEPKHEVTNMDKLETLTRKNARLRTAVVIRNVAIAVFAVLFILFCIVLKLTLDRIM